MASVAGVGISSMKERMTQLQGELKLSRAEPGTLVEASLPLYDGGYVGIGGL